MTLFSDICKSKGTFSSFKRNEMSICFAMWRESEILRLLFGSLCRSLLRLLLVQVLSLSWCSSSKVERREKREEERRKRESINHSLGDWGRKVFFFTCESLEWEQKGKKLVWQRIKCSFYWQRGERHEKMRERVKRRDILVAHVHVIFLCKSLSSAK